MPDSGCKYMFGARLHCLNSWNPENFAPQTPYGIRWYLGEVPRCRMLIFVKTMTGKTISLSVQPSDTIAAVKSRIRELEGLPEGLQTLVFAGRECGRCDPSRGCACYPSVSPLPESGSGAAPSEVVACCTLSDYDIAEHSTVHVVISLRGD